MQKASLVSAGLLMYRTRVNRVQVFLGHPGGPYFAHKDHGYWGIPKGLLNDGEEPLAAAQREFEEETGVKPEGDFVELGTVVQQSGKLVHAWAFEKDWDESAGINSNLIPVEWPPGTGRVVEIPEVDRAFYFNLAEAREKIAPSQIAFLDRLEALLLNRE